MSVFQPPAINQDPPVFPRGTPGQTDAQYFARRRYSSHLTGKNVYRLTDGTITTTQPWDQSLVARVYFGGHIEPVNAAEVALLTAAGYGPWIT